MPTMNVLFIAPGFPDEMPFFTRGLAAVGARVYGLGEQHQSALPELAKTSLAAYLQVDSLWDEESVIAAVRGWLRGATIDRVECLWEPGMVLAARLREALGTPGMSVEQTWIYRDKDSMKRALADAGVRLPQHYRAASVAEVYTAAEALGYPLIVKPIAGAGSADTYRVNDRAELDRTIDATRHVREVSVEEYIEGEEFTFDTICAHGKVLYFNICAYRPKALIARSLHWISPQTMALRDVDHPDLRAGRELGHRVLEALDFQTGFTHMEWFRTPAGEAVFIEIAARAPGGRTVETMNYASDIDVFTGWAEAVCHGQFTQDVQRKYNAVVTFKRAHGPQDGHIERIEGLGSLMARYGSSVVNVSLLPVGARRRNWRSTLLSDGYVILRHPDLQTTMEIADRFGVELQIYAS